MANVIFPKYKTSLLKADASVDLIQTTANVAPWVALVDLGTYTYSASHQYYSSLSGIVGTDLQITTPTVGSVAEGVFDGDDVTFTSVTGASIEAIVIYRKNAGANTTWRLVMFEDTSVTGLPVTPNGGNIAITWNANGIFLLSDVRCKENIRLVGELGVLDLGVYEYNYKGSEQKVRGLLAQEVEKRIPSAVIQFDRHGTRAVNYDAVVAEYSKAA